MLWSLVILSSGITAFFAVKYTTLKLRVAFADDQVRLFEWTRASANATKDPQRLSGQLEQVVNYYPSGSKQLVGTQLDRVVEAARSNAVAAIIGRLRAVTGRDLGDSPEKWLKDYPPSANRRK